MDAETIREKSVELPRVPIGKIADTHEVWEGDDGGAHYMLCRQHKLASGMSDFYTLSLTGNGPDIDRLIDEFSEVFGEPEVVEFNPYLASDTVMVSWLIEECA